jgi:hypothetical protein
MLYHAGRSIDRRKAVPDQVIPQKCPRTEDGCLWHNFTSNLGSCFGRNCAKRPPETASRGKRPDVLHSWSDLARVKLQKVSFTHLRPLFPRYTLGQGAHGRSARLAEVDGVLEAAGAGV